MAVETISFTTGAVTLHDTGELSYNGCIFSPLFETKISGKAVTDNANRTIKYMEYTLVADGYVTTPAGSSNIVPAMRKLRDLLTAQGGELIYRGRGFDLTVNTGRNVGGGGGVPGRGAAIVNLGKLANLDVAWGPVPQLIEFQPLGGGKSAKVQWKVVTRIPEIAGKGPGLLQLNCETGVSYGEDCFSTLTIRGTLEIPLTRSLGQKERGVPRTVDDYRNLISARILKGIDLSRFRVTRREFNVSRDKRTLEWDVTAEELPYMNIPPDCTIARGNYNVRPAKVGMGLVAWLCTLKATYTVRHGALRREAWLWFLKLLRLRMLQSESEPSFSDPPEIAEKQAPKKAGVGKRLGRAATVGGLAFAGAALLGGPPGWIALAGATIGALTTSDDPGTEGLPNANRRAWLIDFTVDEGLYLDSKTVTFSATWRLICKFQYILLASGLWMKVGETDARGNNLWAASMRDISGSRSWLENRLDPTLDVIVDFGSEI